MSEPSGAEHAGRVAIVTGGGRGFGKAFGAALAQRGARVALVDYDAPAADAAAAELRAAGGDVIAFHADVADHEQMSDVIDRVVAEHGGIDILINNAGLHSAEFARPSDEIGLERLRRLFDVNVIGVLNCTLLAQDHMAGRPGAAIVNISSCAAYSCPSAYGVSKLAVQGLTMMSAKELGPRGVRVNGIAPGLIFTDTIREELPGSIVERMMSYQHLDREGSEADIVEMMLYLVSDRARFITGETLRVSGGAMLAI